MGAVMVAKSNNPSCPLSFRPLKEGRLFRLENDLTFRLSNVTTGGAFLTVPLLLVNNDIASHRRRQRDFSSAPRTSSHWRRFQAVIHYL
jgi:hypothetical protein